MIWVIAGTVNGRELIARLLRDNYSVVASVATEFGKEQIPAHKHLTVLSVPLSREDMAGTISRHKIRLIIDSSHPYSIEVSKNAMSTALEKDVPYIRYERKSVEFPDAVILADFNEAADYLKNKQGNILLTIGSKNLEHFSSGYFDGRIYARVLPLKSSLDACGNAGIRPERILAMNFRFSKEFHKSLYKDLGISYLVTKESGEEGGVSEKIMAALETGVEAVIIKRPVINYPEVIYGIDDIMHRVGEILNG